MAKIDVYQAVTDRIVAQLEQAVKWERPWVVSHEHGTLPVSITTGKPYRGMNTVILWSMPYGSPLWGTYKAWAAKGAQVRKGEKGTMILFWKRMDGKPDPTDPDATPGKSYLMARGYYVFNREQVDSYEDKPSAIDAMPEPERVARAEAFVAATAAHIQHKGNRAFYAPALDLIQMPARKQFKSADGYYGTLLHELTHWTSHKSRCDRELSTARFGNETYAMEELVAELGAAFLCVALGVTPEPRADHASYIKGWLKVLKDDKRAIFTAASKAQQAADFLHSFSAPAEVEDETDESMQEAA